MENKNGVVIVLTLVFTFLDLHWMPLTTSKNMQKKLPVISGCSL